MTNAIKINKERDIIEKQIKDLELFEKYINEWIKYKDIFKDITLGQFSENKEAQKNDYLIQIEVIFNEVISEIEKDPKKKTNRPEQIKKINR